MLGTKSERRADFQYIALRAAVAEQYTMSAHVVGHAAGAGAAVGCAVFCYGDAPIQAVAANAFYTQCG